MPTVPAGPNLSVDNKYKKMDREISNLGLRHSTPGFDIGREYGFMWGMSPSWTGGTQTGLEVEVEVELEVFQTPLCQNPKESGPANENLCQTNTISMKKKSKKVMFVAYLRRQFSKPPTRIIFLIPNLIGICFDGKLPKLRYLERFMALLGAIL